jgi:hypothetical protein
MTTKMSMAGMPMQMPAQTTKICRPKGKAWDEPPTSKMAEERCKMTDYQLSNNKATWKVTCNDGMSGAGELTYQSDSFAGTMNISSPEITMKMDMSGRRVGDCDATETVKMAERTRKSLDEVNRTAPGDPMAKMCADGAAKFQYMAFVGPSAVCKDKEQMAALCKRLYEEANYETLVKASSPENDAMGQVTAACGTSAQALRDSLCKQATESGSYDFLSRNCAITEDSKTTLCPRALKSEALDFLVKHCNKDAKAYAAQHCAGRKFTAIPQEKVRTFCVNYAGTLLGP